MYSTYLLMQHVFIYGHLYRTFKAAKNLTYSDEVQMNDSKNF